MDKFDDKLKQRFQNAKLNDEAWLEPSNDAFAQIEKAIAQPEEDRYKKFLHLIIAGLIISMIFMYLILSKGKTDGLSQVNPPIEHKEVYNSNSIGFTSSEEASILNKIKPHEADESNVELENTDYLSQTEAKKQNINLAVQAYESTTLQPLKDKKHSITNITGVSAQRNTSTMHRSSSYSISTEIKTHTTLNSNSKKQAAIPHNSINQAESAIPHNSIESIAILPKLSLALAGTQTLMNIGPRHAAIPINPVRKNNAYLDISFSTIFWKDKLNSNYLGALSPADFSQNAERGYGLNVSYHKHITRPIAIGFQVGYSDIEINSGHNTILNYDVGAELNGTQSFSDLTLATPYGFVQSDLTVSRAVTNADETRSLNASIHSKHNIKILKFAPSLDLHVFERSNFNLIINLNTGLNYILTLKNEIDFLNTGHADYALQNGSIIEEQSNVNTSFWSAGLGIRTQYSISSNVSFGARIAFSEGLTPLFKMDDFSGRARATELGLNTTFRF